MGTSDPPPVGEPGAAVRTTRRSLLRADLVAALGAGIVLDGAEASGATFGQALPRSAMPGRGGGALSTQVIFRAAPNQRCLSLTFDDGPTRPCQAFTTPC